MNKTPKRKAFLFGSGVREFSVFNNPGTDKHFSAWLGDEEFTGLDRLAVERDAQVAVGFSFLKHGSHYE